MVGMAPSIAESEARLEAAYADFAGRYPAYAETAALDRLRATDTSVWTSAARCTSTTRALASLPNRRLKTTSS